MQSRRVQYLALAVIAVAWVSSFFLPAIDPGGGTHPLRGYIAFILSFLSLKSVIEGHDVLVSLYLGSFWMANLFMLASPLGLKFARRGRGVILIAMMLFWDVLTLSYLIYDHFEFQGKSAHLGWWMWELSLFAMTGLLVMVRREALLPRAD